MTPPPPGRTSSDAAVRPQIRILLGAVFLVHLGQMTLNPIIAPLSREVRLAEWQLGVAIGTAALMVVLTGRFWGRRSQSWGRRPVLIVALGIAVVSMASFALVAWLGTTGVLAGTGLFALFVLLRGVGFGTAIAAVPTTAQAYVADVTVDERERLRGMAGIGATQGVAMIAGAVVGGGLAAFGLLTPLVVVPLLHLGAFTVVVLALPREPRTTLVERPARVRVTDPRVWPFLLAGLGLFTALGLVQVVTGFLVQDRLRLDPAATGTVTGGALLAAGAGMALAQGVVVPRSGWRAPTLLRVGGVVALAGFVLLTPDAGAVALIAAMLLVGLGMGIAMPGYTGGASLLVERHEQGGVAGLTTATTAVTYVPAPAVGTALYGVWGPLPVLVSVAVMALVTTFVLVHPRFSREHSHNMAG